jgi:class 3 adenylate cyclase/tetratricopeptide (TPR) repeat protein
MSDIRQWLDSLGLGQYADSFAEHAIEWEILTELDHDVLKDVGVSVAGHRLRILKAAKALGSAEGTTTSHSPGEPLSAQTPVPGSEAEHRQLTVMFCDLADSTALAGRLDTEIFRDVILAYQQACTRSVERYEGYVARFFGDGMLVYFGYPHAHEDDAERAIHAGLEVLREMDAVGEEQRRTRDIELSVRIGIATGPVVVGDIVGEGASQESTVLGETPNLAARLQALAGGNQIVVAPATHRLAGGAFEYQDLGPQSLKGIDEPVNAWQVVGTQDQGSRFEAAHGKHLAPLIGRDEERDMLLRRWRLAADGAGQVVLVSGEAGIGKSRLARGLREHLADQPHTVLNYQCSPYHVSSALHPIINQLERAAGFSSEDAPESKLDKLEHLLGQSSDQFEHAACLLAALLGLPGAERYGSVDLTPEQQKDQTLVVLVEQLEGLASRRPVLMVFEDMHWVDPTTLELLDLMVDRIPAHPVLALLTHRPDLTPTWTGEAHVTSIALTKLGPENCTSLVSAVTGDRALPDEVLREIVKKTDGVPLFVEELTKTVIESGMLRAETARYVLDQPLPALAIPATLQDSLMARLDRLASVKDIAQIGAVIGREFGHQLLEAVAGLSPSVLSDGLAKLAEAGLVFRRGTPPHASYLFKHALIQDTAYASLLKSRRQQLHGKIASVLETRFPALTGSQPELAAHHLGQAGLTARAIEYWQRASALARSRSAMHEAYSHLGTALAAQKTLPQTDENRRLRLDLLIERITPIIAVKSYSSPEMAELYEDAMSVYRTIGDDTPQIFPIIYAGWAYELTVGRTTEALERAREFLTSAERQRARIPTLMGRRLCGAVMVMDRAAVEGCRYLEQVLEELDEELSDQIGFVFGQDMLAAANTYYAFGLCALGKFEQARQRMESALDRAARLENPLTIAYVNGHVGLLFAEMRDDAGLTRCIATMESTLGEHPMPIWVLSLEYLRGVKALVEERNDTAAALIENSMTTSERLGFGYWRATSEGSLARARLAQAQHERALECVSRGLAAIDRGADAWIEPELYRIRGDILAAWGQPRAEIEDSYQEAISKAGTYPHRLYELRAALGLARHWEADGRVEESMELLDSVCASIPQPGDIREMRTAREMLSERTR